MSDTQGFDYLSLDGLVTENTKGWSGEKSSLPPGDYLVRINEVKQEPPSKNQNPQISVQYEVVEGEHKGRKTRCWYTLKGDGNGGGAITRLVALLDAAGVSYKRPDGTFGFQPPQLVNQEVVIGVFDDVVPGEMNPMTGKADSKTFTKVFNERPRSAWGKIKEMQSQKSA